MADAGGTTDVVIVGGGLAGLACAEGASGAGLAVEVVEAEPEVGGRTRTRLHAGVPVDRGFQALFSAYPETDAFMGRIGVEDEDLRRFDRSVVVHDGNRWVTVRPGARGIRRAGFRSGRAAARVVADVARAAKAGRPGSGTDGTVEEYLTGSGVEAAGIDAVIRPFVGAVTLDRALGADGDYVRFLLGMLVRGPAVLPVDGIGMLAARAAETVRARGARIATGTRVEALVHDGGRVQGVLLGDGAVIRARAVVLAVPARVAAGLLAGVDDAAAARLPDRDLGSVTAAFSLAAPLYAGRTLLLDAAAPEGTDRVDLICQTSNVTRPGGTGPHVLVAQSATAGWRDVDPERYARAVADRIRAWAPGYPWDALATPIDAHACAHAQYAVPPGLRAGLPGPGTALGNLVLAGDAVTHPSIEGAVSAGVAAAQAVRAALA
jgi:phytoene dehydrogenase-like protein